MINKILELFVSFINIFDLIYVIYKKIIFLNKLINFKKKLKKGT
jgi:hypothetical protein